MLILVASLLLKLNHLGHASIKGLDESFHALVAKNLIKHPLTPTLYDATYLPYDYRDWQNNHVWLHKPIVPLWQMAASMAALGVNTLALRLPSALLSTLAVWLTYAIGVELLGRRAALIAAALQAFNPGIVSLVHGYVFSDHVDIAFLFWVELSAWALVRAVQTGSMRWTIAAGIAQGIAYLCKTYPAFVLTGVAIVICWMAETRRNVAWASRPSFRRRNLIIFVAATIAAIAPWTIWCMIRFPREFFYEQFQVFRHLSSDVEGWAAPWDRLIFDFSLRIYHVFYPAVLTAVIVLLPRCWRERDWKLGLLYAWGLGVLLPLTMATSKTPTATLIGWPPFLLILGLMISRALDGDTACLIAWAVVTGAGAFFPGAIPQKGWGYPDPPQFARIMRDNIWVISHVAMALGTAAAAGWVFRERGLPRNFKLSMLVLAALASGWLFVRMTDVAWRVSALNRERPSFVELGAAARRDLPANAVLLFEIGQKCEHIMLMFHADRSVYPVTEASWPAMARQIRSAGGRPLLVTPRSLSMPVVFDRPLDGLRVYEIGETPVSR